MKAFALFAALLIGAALSFAAEPQLDAAQEEAVKRLTAKGGLVLPLAQDTDALVVNLSLAGRETTDEELALVKSLPKVVQLNLAGTGITDGGLAHIAGLSSVTHLHLEKTPITDSGLVHLKGLANLNYLNLYDTAVTDAGLEHLKELKSLKRLYLWQTKVTDAGAEALKSALPDAYINRGEELALQPPKAEEKPAEKPEEKAAQKPADKAAATAVNTTCPVSGEPVDPQFTFAFEGRTIGFCCNNCLGKFKEDPKQHIEKVKADAVAAKAEKEEAAKPDKPEKAEEPEKVEPAKEEKPAADKPEAAAKPVNTVCPVSGEEIDSAITFTFDGKLIAFCCDGCKEKFEKEPKKFAEKLK